MKSVAELLLELPVPLTQAAVMRALLEARESGFHLGVKAARIADRGTFTCICGERHYLGDGHVCRRGPRVAESRDKMARAANLYAEGNYVDDMGDPS